VSSWAVALALNLCLINFTELCYQSGIGFLTHVDQIKRLPMNSRPSQNVIPPWHTSCKRTCAFALHITTSTLCQDICSPRGNESLGISFGATALSRNFKMFLIVVSSIIHKHMSPSVLALSHTVCPSRSLVSSWPAITLSLLYERYTGTEGATQVRKKSMQPRVTDEERISVEINRQLNID
jgi:hypothetical protein